MDDLKKNAYWVVMGVLVLAAAAFWTVQVAFGKNAEVAKQTRALQAKVKTLLTYAHIPDDEVADPKKGMPVPAIVQYWEDRRKALEQEKAAVEQKYRNKDQYFETLPPDVARGKDGYIPLEQYTNFISGFHKEIDELKGRYKGLVQDGATADKVFGIADPPQGQDDKILIAQKQYLIEKAIAEAAAAKDVGAKQITEFVWKEVAAPEQKPKDGAAPEPRVVTRIGVTVTIEMPFPNVGMLIARLLRSPVIFDLRGLKVEATGFSYPELDPYKVFDSGPAIPGASAPSEKGGMRVFAKEVYVARSDLSDPKTKNEPPVIAEPPVAVHITLDALDFDIPEAKPAEVNK